MIKKTKKTKNVVMPFMEKKTRKKNSLEITSIIVIYFFIKTLHSLSVVSTSYIMHMVLPSPDIRNMNEIYERVEAIRKEVFMSRCLQVYMCK